MDFITIPVTLGIAVFGFYKLVELYVRKKERLLIIDKLSQLENADVEKFSLSGIFGSKGLVFNQFTSLRIGSLLVGLGLGILVGYLIVQGTYYQTPANDFWRYKEILSVVMGATTLLFGGLGLVFGFIIERNMLKK